jgi:hypothetical protein
MGWPEVMRRSGNDRSVGEEDEADSPGPLDRETREKRPARKTRTKREDVLPRRHHRRMGQMGRQGWLRPVRGAGPAGQKAEWVVGLAGPKTKKENFFIKN